MNNNVLGMSKLVREVWLDVSSDADIAAAERELEALARDTQGAQKLRRVRDALDAVRAEINCRHVRAGWLMP